MHRKLYGLLALAMLLTGCRAQTPEETPSPTQSALQTQPTTVQTTVPETSPVPVFTPTVLVDDAHCTFQVLSVDPNDDWGYGLRVYLENKTATELMFAWHGVSVNGYMCDPFFAVTVSPGMKANEEVSFLQDDLAANGITDVTDISFTLSVYDSTDLLSDRLVEEECILYPQGEAAFRTYTRQPQATDRVLFDTEDCAMILTGFDPEHMWGYAMDVYLENKTEDTLMFSADQVAVNGYMCDPYWAVEVAPGKKCNTQISWMASDFADNGITRVETITLPVRVYESDEWLDEALIHETFTIQP